MTEVKLKDCNCCSKSRIYEESDEKKKSLFQYSIPQG